VAVPSQTEPEPGGVMTTLGVVPDDDLATPGDDALNAAIEVVTSR